MIDINAFSKKVFNALKTHIEVDNKDSSYGASVIVRNINNTYPVVVFQTNSNIEASKSIDKYGLTRTRSLSFEISIIAVDKNDTGVSSIEICERLENLVTEIMQYVYNMKGGTDQKLTNINNSNASEYILHFTCEWDMGRNTIY